LNLTQWLLLPPTDHLNLKSMLPDTNKGEIMLTPLENSVEIKSLMAEISNCEKLISIYSNAFKSLPWLFVPRKNTFVIQTLTSYTKNGDLQNLVPIDFFS